MKLGLSLLALVLIATHAFATDLASALGGGSQEFEYTKYTDQYIQMKIHESAQVNCKKGMCTLFAQTTNSQGFTVEFSVGENANGGYSSGGNGTVVVVPGSGSTTGTVQPYIGLTLRYNVGTCTQKVKVPESLYVSMNTFLYNFMNEDGTPVRGFTPADEAMIMFYSTIMKQATGCR